MIRPLLIVDDAATIREPLAAYFQQEGYGVVTARDCAEARAALAHEPALVILDWTLPDGHGTDLLREWRREGRTVPVILLTAKAELVDKVVGLELGANDYVTKPFEPRELLARVKAHLRASAGPDAAPLVPKRLCAGGVALDPASRSVALGGDPVELTKLEFDLLRLLLENPGRVFSRDELLNRVWGYESYPTTRTVDTHVLQLRQKLPGLALETVRGIGYRLTKL